MKCSLELLLLFLLLTQQSQQQGSCPREDFSTTTDNECYQRSVLCQYYPYGRTCSDNINEFTASVQGGNTEVSYELRFHQQGFTVSPGSTDYEVGVVYGCNAGAVTVENFDAVGVMCSVGIFGVDPGLNLFTFSCAGLNTLTIDDSSIVVFTLNSTGDSQECSNGSLPDAKFAILDTSGCVDIHCDTRECSTPESSLYSSCRGSCQFYFNDPSVFSPCLEQDCNELDESFCAVNCLESPFFLSQNCPRQCFTTDEGINCLSCQQEFCERFIEDVCDLDCTQSFEELGVDNFILCGRLCSTFLFDLEETCCHNPCTPRTNATECSRDLDCVENFGLCASLCFNSSISTDDGKICNAFIEDVCDLNCGSSDDAAKCDTVCLHYYNKISNLCQSNPCPSSAMPGSNQSLACAGSVFAGLNCEMNLTVCVRLCFNATDTIDSSLRECQTTFCRDFTRNCSSPLYDLTCSTSQTERPLCDEICSGTTFITMANGTQFCEEAEDLVNYCLGIDDTVCNELAIFETDCTVDRAVCSQICTMDISHALTTVCTAELNTFCRVFLNMLTQENLTEQSYNTGVSVIDRFIREAAVINGTLQDIGSFVDLLYSDLATSTAILGADQMANGLMQLFDGIYNDNQLEEWNDLDSNDAAREESLEDLELVSQLIGSAFIDGTRVNSFKFTGQSLAMDVGPLSADDRDRGEYVFPAPGLGSAGAITESIETRLSTNLLCDNNPNDCSAIVAASITRNLAVYVDETLQDSKEVVNSNLFTLQVFESPGFLDRLRNNPIDFTFKISNNDVDLNSHRCVTWNFGLRNWTDVGINTTVRDNSTVMCSTTHLSSFAVLVSVTRVEVPDAESIALQVVSYIGCVISILSLVVTIIALVVFRKSLKKGVLLYVHINLASALLLALLVFVAGIETAISHSVLCTIVAALLHYFFLCVFAWMLCEAIMLYLLVVRVFGMAAKKWYYLLLLGWGLPLIIVGVSAGVLAPMDLYIDTNNTQFCWISSGNASHPALWTFVVPMLIIILINTVILIMTVVSMVRGKKYGGAEVQVKNKDLAKTAIKATVILLPLLGITWVFGLFAVNANTSVFAWLFTIFNSLQGLFILVFHVLRNDAIVRRLKKRFGFVKEKAKYSTTTFQQEASGMSKTMEMSMTNVVSRGTLTSVTSDSELLSNESRVDASTETENCGDGNVSESERIESHD